MRQRTFLSLISIFLLMGNAYADDNINTVINQDPIANRIVNYSVDSKYKLPYMAVTSEEVSDLSGFWQSNDHEKNVAPHILKRAVSICAQDNGELVDFEIEATRDNRNNGKFVLLDLNNKSKRVTTRKFFSNWSRDSNPMTAANSTSVGVTTRKFFSNWSRDPNPMIAANSTSAKVKELIAVTGNRSWKTIGMAISVDLGLNYGVDLMLEKIKKLSLDRGFGLKRVHFKKVTCVNSENLTKKQIGDQKLKYHCPKFDTTKPYCNKFKSFGQFQCFRYGETNRNFSSTDEQTMKVCEKIIDNVQLTCVNSALKSRWKPNLKYATEHCSRISTPYQGMAVMKALESLNLKDSVNQVLKLKTDEQAQVATKAMDKLDPVFAIELILKLEREREREQELVQELVQELKLKLERERGRERELELKLKLKRELELIRELIRELKNES